MEQRSVTLLLIAKPRAIDNMASMIWGFDVLRVIGKDATKIYAI